MATAATITVRITVETPEDAARDRCVDLDSSAEDGGSDDADLSDGILPASVRQMLENYAPRAEAELYVKFLERCAEELRVRFAVPRSGNRSYVNINPPIGRRGGRLAALNVASGRLHVKLPPNRVDE